MEIIMFIIFIVTNLFIILCMQFAYTHAYKYENGMYLNVHIPSSHKEDAEVTEICYCPFVVDIGIFWDEESAYHNCGTYNRYSSGDGVGGSFSGLW